MKQNLFNTLNEALTSEALQNLWPIGLNIAYNEVVRLQLEDNYLIVVTRTQYGMYERPVHYHG